LVWPRPVGGATRRKILDEIDASSLRFLRSRAHCWAPTALALPSGRPAARLTPRGRRLATTSRRQRMSADRWARHASRAAVRGPSNLGVVTTIARTTEVVSPREPRYCSTPLGGGQLPSGAVAHHTQPVIRGASYFRTLAGRWRARLQRDQTVVDRRQERRAE